MRKSPTTLLWQRKSGICIVFGCFTMVFCRLGGFLKDLGIPDVLGGMQASASASASSLGPPRILQKSLWPRSGAKVKQCLLLQSLNTTSSQIVQLAESQELLFLKVSTVSNFVLWGHFLMYIHHSDCKFLQPAFWFFLLKINT